MAVRDRLVLSTIARMRRDGVAATGIRELIADAHVARRSVYLNFPGGKAELLAEATTVAGQFITDSIARFSSEGSPVQALSAFLDQWRSELVSSDFEAGCPIMAAALGRSHAPAAADAAAAIFTQWGDLMSTALHRTGVEARWADDLAHSAIATIEGAILMCVAHRSTQPLAHAERVLKRLFENAEQLAG